MLRAEETARESAGITDDRRLDLYRRMLRIRRAEETLLDLFARGRLFGTTHTSIGQEAIALAVMEALDLERDVVFSAHRCHGHYLAYGGSMEALFAEIMGRATGVCSGIGGSQHLHHRNFATSGIQGAIVPQAVGAALAEERLGTGAVSVAFMGDGTLGEGVVYEALNMASLWSAPVLFVLEDNRYAQSTPRELAVAGGMVERARAFDVEADEVESNDVEVLLPRMHRAVARVRDERRPFFQVVHTYRLAAHSKGDDLRDPEEIEAWRARDPLIHLENRISGEEVERIRAEVEEEVAAAVDEAESAPWPESGRPGPPASSGSGPESRRDARVPSSGREAVGPPVVHADPDPHTGQVAVVRDLNAALHRLLEEDDRVLVMGEDLLDPYGGAFKVTKGLSSRFPDRVVTTPISEAGIVGVANGLALRGLRPVVEIMFGDFLALAADQILNHAVKFREMYDGQASCPLTIRTPMGGRRGYGPTHSQSLEKHFLGTPGLDVVAPSALHGPGELLRRAVTESEGPTLFIENKLLYGRSLRVPDPAGYVGSFRVRTGGGRYPTVHLSLDEFRRPDVAILTYGGSVELCMEAAERLLVEREISCEILVPSLLSPFPVEDLLPRVAETGRAVVVEEGVTEWGWGAEVASRLIEEAGTGLRSGSVARVGARFGVIPASRPLEEAVLPRVQDVMRAVEGVL